MRPFPGAASKWSTMSKLLAGSPWRSGLAALAAATLPGSVSALGLGQAVGSSVLGETLHLEVPLAGSLDGPLDDNCVAVRRPNDPIDSDYYPRDLVVHLDNAGGNLRLQIASKTAIRQPLIQFGVSVTCGYNLARDYLIAVSPPKPSAEPVPASPPTLAPAIAAAPAATLVPATATPVSTPDGLPAKNVTLDRDMTLEQLARQHFPGPLRQGRFMRWVVEANPQLFADSKDKRQQRLAAGTQLLIPEGIPPRRRGDYQDGSSPLDGLTTGGPTKVTATEAVSRPERTRAAKGGRDRLVVGSGGSVARDYKEAVAMVQHLTNMLEQQVAAQSANESRIHQLEAGAEELKTQIAQVQAAAQQREAQFQAQIQAQMQAAQRAQDELAARAWWQVAIAVLVGGALAAVVLQGYRMLAARRSESEPAESAPSEPAVTGAQPPVAADKAESHPPPSASAPPSPARVTVRSASVAQVRKPKPVKDPLDFEPPSFLHGEAKRITTADNVAVDEVAVQELPDPAKAAIELANIMTSMGLTESAAQTLVDHIRENPRQSLQHWLKLLELHRINGKRQEYERSSEEMRLHFNVQADHWSGGSGAGRETLEAYPHIRAQIVRRWHDSECVKYLHSLLMDNREGTRSGFPLSVAEEILLLIAIQSDVQ